MNLKKLCLLLFIFLVAIAFIPQAFASNVDNSTEITDNNLLEITSDDFLAGDSWYESQPTEESETISYNGGNRDIDFHATIEDYFARSDSPKYFGNLKLYAYVNEDSTNRVELSDYDGAAGYIKFNLNLIESKLHDGENQITVHPDEDQMKSYTCYQYNFIPAIVYYNTDSYSYSTTPYPASLDYVMGENKTVDVDVRYDESLNETLKNLDMYMFINDEKSIKIDGVKGSNSSFTINLYDVKDYLTKDTNTVVFHPNLDGITNSTLFNKLTVNVVEPIYDYYISTPDPSVIEEYVRNTDENVTIYTQYWEGLSQVLGLIDMCVYINDIEGYNWDFIRGVKANESEFTFNLNDISSDLEDGQNKLYFAPKIDNFFHIFEGDKYTFNPLIVSVNKSSQIDDYISTPTPSEVFYKMGESEIISVNITYPDDVDISESSMFVYINGEELENRVVISGVDSGESYFTFDLAIISDKLTDGINNLTFHPNPGMLEYYIRGDLIFNKLTVIVGEGIINTTLSVNDSLNLYVGENSKIKANYTPSSAKITYLSNNESIATVDENGIVTGISEGVVNVTVIVGDDVYYKMTNASVSVNVAEFKLINTSLSVDDDSLLLNISDSLKIIYAVVPENLTVNFQSKNENIAKVDENGIVTALKSGSTIITLTAGDNITYKISSVDVNVTVLKIKTAIDINDSLTLNVSDTLKLDVNITPSDAKGEFSYLSNDTNIVTIDENATLAAVSNGTALITVIFNETDRYLQSNATVVVNVLTKISPKSNLTIKAYSNEITVGENATVIVGGFEDAEGNVSLKVGNSIYISDIVNSCATFVVPGLLENSTGVVYYGGDENYNDATTSVLIIVNPKVIPKGNLTINASADQIIVGEDAGVIVNGFENATGVVSLRILDSIYISDIVDSSASFVVPGLLENSTGVVYYAGDENYNGATTSVIIIVNPKKAQIIVIVDDVTKYYKGSERFVVNVTDGEANPIANKSVEININGKDYTRTTDENGLASMALGLNSGVYNVTTKVDKTMVNSVVTILATVNGTDLVKVFRNQTQYYATFRDCEGNYLANGTKVQFNINGVLYNRYIGGNEGLARLNINLIQGEYILTAMNPVTGENYANNITVLSKIQENNDITKYYKNETQYTVKIFGEEGKTVGSGENVTFNINGVFYTRQTDASGIAKLSINLPEGDYVITAEYNGCKVANNITVLPVLSAKDITMKYRDGTKFVATLLDGQGKPYAGQTVQFNINGVFYNKVTDANGQAKLNINLLAGKYIITSSYNGANIANTITITA